MKNIIQFLLLMAALLIGVSAKGQCNPASDRAELMKFYNATGGNILPGWNVDTNWGSNEPLGEWYGINTNTDGCVIDIIMSNNNLDGIISTLNFPFLERFLVPNNNLGEIPPLDNLTNLRYFWCHDNNIKGEIPPLDNLINLQNFNCNNNNIEGEIPPLDNLVNLQNFNCNNNNIEGEIPPLDNLTNLRYFWCDDNDLEGEIPPLNNLINLKSFKCNINSIEGEIPPLNNLTNLEVFWCGDNYLEGEIPPLNNLTNLNSFWCGRNHLEGEIPPLNNLTNLYYFGCSNNYLEGEIPPLNNLTNLAFFYCSNNKLIGEIPILDNLPNLLTFWCHENDLSGCYPESICDIPSFRSENNLNLPWEGNHNPFCNGEDPCGDNPIEDVNCCDPIPVDDLTIECIGDDLIICLPEIVGCAPVPGYTPLTVYARLTPIINGSPVASQTIHSPPLIPNMTPNSPNCITVTDSDGYDSSLDYQVSMYYWADCDNDGVPNDNVSSVGNVTFEGGNVCIGDPHNCCDLEMVLNPLECGSFEICLSSEQSLECDLHFSGDFRGVSPDNILNPDVIFPSGCYVFSGFSPGEIVEFDFSTEVIGCGQQWHHIYYEVPPCGVQDDNPNWGLISNDNNNHVDISVPQVIPNPFSDNFQIQFSLEQTEEYQLVIYDQQGKSIHDIKGTLIKGYNSIEVNQLNKMPAGIYYYQLNTNSNQFSDKLIKY